MRVRTTADLVVPVDTLRGGRRPWLALQQKVFDKLRAFIDDPRSTPAARLALLAQMVAPLAQVQVFLGVPADVAFEHAAELLESMFVADALRDAPDLASWFE